MKAIRAQPLVSVDTISSLPKQVEPDTLVVIQGELPPALPKGNVFIVEPKGRCELFAVGDTLTTPVVGHVDDSAVLTRFLSLDNLVVPGAKKIVPEKTDIEPEILISTSGGDPLLLQWDRPSGRVVVLAVNPSRGELVFRVSFPLLIANVISVCRDETGVSNRFRFALPLAERLEHSPNHKLRFQADPSKKETAKPVAIRAGQSRPAQQLWFCFGCLALAVSIAEWIFYHRRVIE